MTQEIIYNPEGEIALSNTLLSFLEDTTNPIWNDLTSYWRFEEGSSTFYDSIGDVDLTNSGALVEQTGINNYCIDLDGTSDYVYGGTPDLDFERTDSWTFSLWVKRRGTGLHGLVFNRLNSGTYRGYALTFTSTGFQLEHVGTSGSSEIVIQFASTVSSTANWYHVVWTYDGSSTAAGHKLYLDGVEQTSRTITANNLTTTTVPAVQFKLGIYGTSPYGLYGKLDETAVWTRELTSTQVTELYDSGDGLFY